MRKDFYISALFVMFVATVACLFVISTRDTKPEKTLPITVSIAENKTLKVSPHGFGPYPKLPDIWPKDYWDKERTRESELIGRVRIKLYNEGKWTEGATLDHDTGMVYPVYKDTVYVKWATYTDLKGNTRRYITSAKGYPDTMELLERAQHIKDMPRSKLILDYLGLTEQSLPPGIKFVPYEEGAIDPIEYLGLK